MSTTEEILNYAMALSASDRALLAHQLLDSLDSDYCDPEWETAWRAEIERRLDAVDSGAEKTEDCHQALEVIRASLSQKRSS
jgi:putative addiction module component (TIGR02574 family)